MNKGRILVLENDIDMSKMLRIYFDSQGYEVHVANQSQDIFPLCRTKLPGVIILGVSSPNSDSYNIYRTLQSNIRTSYIPIIFLIQIGGQESKISELQVNMDNVIVSPFDIEKLREHIDRNLRRKFTHPITYLPTGKLIEEQLNKAKQTSGKWVLLYCSIRRSPVASEFTNETLIFLAGLLNETIDFYGSPNDYIGHSSDNDFVVITTPQTASIISEVVTRRFNEQMGQATTLSWNQIDL